MRGPHEGKKGKQTDPKKASLAKSLFGKKK